MLIVHCVSMKTIVRRNSIIVVSILCRFDTSSHKRSGTRAGCVDSSVRSREYMRSNVGQSNAGMPLTYRKQETKLVAVTGQGI